MPALRRFWPNVEEPTLDAWMNRPDGAVYPRKKRSLKRVYSADVGNPPIFNPTDACNPNDEHERDSQLHQGLHALRRKQLRAVTAPKHECDCDQ